MKSEEWGRQLEQLFASIGLSEKESRAYRVLLESGELSAGEIIKRARLKRGITYAVLYNLEKDGLVSQVKKGKKTIFRPESPHKLNDLLLTKKTQIENVASSFSQLLPKLSSQYKLAVGRPTVAYFEGEEGLKTVFDDVYAPGKNMIWGCVDLEITESVFPSHITKNLIPKRMKHNIQARALLADSPAARKVASLDADHLRLSILVAKDQFPLPAEIEVYADKVAFLSFAKADFLGLVVENPDIAESMRSIFRYIFALKYPQTVTEK